MVAHISSYGDSFADVYDDWYAAVSDVDGTVAFLQACTPPGSAVLELGSGTGRLAAPLASAGVDVVGLDASRAMLASSRRAATLHTVEGDMVRLPFRGGSFATVFVAFNTLFNLQSEQAMGACFHEVRRVLADKGSFVVEAFVPPAEDAARDHGVSMRSLARDVAVLTSAARDPDRRTITGQHVEIQRDRVRLRPWRIVYANPSQLDVMAGAAGLELNQRFEGWRGEPFDEGSPQHVSVFRTA